MEKWGGLVLSLAAGGAMWLVLHQMQDNCEDKQVVGTERPTGFLDFPQLCERVPLSPRTLRAALKAGHLPKIRLPGARRLLFDWPAVQAALKRFEEGGIGE